MSLSRRAFLQIAALSLGALAAGRLSPSLPPGALDDPARSLLNGRVTRRTVDVLARPEVDSRRTARLVKDTLVEILEEFISPQGPAANPLWYRLGRGYVHSASIQRCDGAHLNLPLGDAPESGRLGEISVPYAQSWRQDRQGEWLPLYRLYFGSLHWITGVWLDADGLVWYRLTDEWLKIDLHVPAAQVRPLEAEELAPLSPHAAPELKRIEVSLAEQMLYAYEGERLVYTAQVASGRRWMETPSGEFQVNRKAPSKHMGNGALTSDPAAYELPGVPWTTFFHTNGVALHGTYWHDNFGAPMSQGCVNLRIADARWAFRWSTPVFDPQVTSRKGWIVKGKGTAVKVY